MRASPVLIVLLGLGVSTVRAEICRAAESTAASVVVTAQFASRTSLRVSTQVLEFEVASADRSAVALVDFSAAARTRQTGEVVLTVERAGPLNGPRAAADVETSLSFSGDGAGVAAGELRPSARMVAGRWVGSGRRTGQLAFTLRSSVPGAYSVPVSFVLSAP